MKNKFVLSLLIAVVLITSCKNDDENYISPISVESDIIKDDDLESLLKEIEYAISYEETIIYLILFENNKIEVQEYNLSRDDKNQEFKILIPNSTETVILSLHENQTIAGKWSSKLDNDKSLISEYYIEPLSNNRYEIIYGADDTRKNIVLDVSNINQIDIELNYAVLSSEEFNFGHIIKLIKDM